MSRALLLSALLVAGCTKSAPKDNGSGDSPKADVVKVPGGDVPPPGMGKAKGGGQENAVATGGADPQKLAADEGKLAIVAPADAKAGAETIAKITVTPA